MARAGFTVLGGLIAVAANMLLWPSWEPEQVRSDLARAIAAHAAYARAVLCGAGADPGPARRQAGLASNNLEATLQRAMHEPRRGQRDRLQAILVADAALRRIAGRLVALSIDPTGAGAKGGSDTRNWIVETLQALAEGRPTQGRPDMPCGVEGLERLARQVEVLDFALRKEDGVPLEEAGARPESGALGVTGSAAA